MPDIRPILTLSLGQLFIWPRLYKVVIRIWYRFNAVLRTCVSNLSVAAGLNASDGKVPWMAFVVRVIPIRTQPTANSSLLHVLTQHNSSTTRFPCCPLVLPFVMFGRCFCCSHNVFLCRYTEYFRFDSSPRPSSTLLHTHTSTPPRGLIVAEIASSFVNEFACLNTNPYTLASTW